MTLRIGAGAIGRDHIRRLTQTLSGAQVVHPRRSPHAPAGLQIVPLETVKGVRVDVEIFVNCVCGHDIRCEVVGETGAARPPEPSAAPLRSGARLSTAILTDRKDRFVDGHDVELRDFIDAARDGASAGPTARDGYAAAADACVAAQGRPGEIPPITMPERPALYV